MKSATDKIIELKRNNEKLQQWLDELREESKTNRAKLQAAEEMVKALIKCRSVLAMAMTGLVTSKHLEDTYHVADISISAWEKAEKGET